MEHDRVVLTGCADQAVHRELVGDVLAETGRREERKRLLPARVVVYFVLALALFYGDSYEEVMRKLVQDLSWLAIWKKEWHVPTSSALTQARERLGREPLRELFERAAVPWRSCPWPESTVSASAVPSMSFCYNSRACTNPSWSMNQRRNTPVSTT